uniref:Collagen IV NC1 domain-containing protein n=1 Tax=Labrus bergylta TaxID=56723 RepID=A0A3Q3E6J7_9LABR
EKNLNMPPCCPKSRLKRLIFSVVLSILYTFTFFDYQKGAWLKTCTSDWSIHVINQRFYQTQLVLCFPLHQFTRKKGFYITFYESVYVSGSRGDCSCGPPAEIRGPPGPVDSGFPGFPGQKGLAGPSGPVGTSVIGAIGQRGAPGNMGPPGQLGFPGQMTPPLPPANKNSDNVLFFFSGCIGEKGDIGEDGPPGFGPKGSEGKPGSSGFPGYPGLQGPTGVNGDSGLPGPRGQKGKGSARVPWTAWGHWSPREEGSRGFDGRGGAQGCEGPKGEKGKNWAFGEKVKLSSPIPTDCRPTRIPAPHSRHFCDNALSKGTISLSIMMFHCGHIHTPVS